MTGDSTLGNFDTVRFIVIKISLALIFLHYVWFIQNLGKDFIQTNMHTTVVDKRKEDVLILKHEIL